MTPTILSSQIQFEDGSQISFIFQVSQSPEEFSEHRLSIDLARIEALREPVVLSFHGTLDADGSFYAQSDIPEGLYEIVAATLRGPGSSEAPLQLSVDGDIAFAVPPSENADVTIAAIRENRAGLMHAPIFAEGATDGSPPHLLVTFFSGVKLHSPQIMEGLWVLPVEGRIGIESLETILTRHLGSMLQRQVEISQQARSEYASSNPVFCIVVPHIKADSREAALEKGSRVSLAVSDLLTVERGERPRKLATYFCDEEVESFWPETPKYRGNYLAPLFADDQADLIETWLPLMQREGVASLYLNLLAEAVGERNPAYQHFRYWALIEQIAVSSVVSDTLPLTLPDGSAMTISGRAQFTKGALRKVYYYLFSENIGNWDVTFTDSNGNDVSIAGVHRVGQSAPRIRAISFFDALEAAYELRNQVAHKGHFDTVANSLPRALLAKELRSNFEFNSWFRDIVKTAVLSELRSITRQNNAR